MDINSFTCLNNFPAYDLIRPYDINFHVYFKWQVCQMRCNRILYRNNGLPKSHVFVNIITNKLHMHTQKVQWQKKCSVLQNKTLKTIMSWLSFCITNAIMCHKIIHLIMEIYETDGLVSGLVCISRIHNFLLAYCTIVFFEMNPVFIWINIWISRNCQRFLSASLLIIILVI